MNGRAGLGRNGRVRVARLTDLAALGELSRIAQRDTAGARSLGLPVPGRPIGVFNLFRLPLGAFRPNDLLYVYEENGGLAGLARVERDGHRDEWTIVELDAVASHDSGDIRHRLVQHILRDGTRRGAVRFHVACCDHSGNVDLFMQSGFVRYGEELVLVRAADEPLPAPWSEEQAHAAGIRPAGPLDAVALHRLHASTTPLPVQRLELVRIADWEARPGSVTRVPRTSLTPILRFADVEAYVQESPAGAGDPGGDLRAFVQVGVAREEQPHYLKVVARPEHDPSDLIAFALGTITARDAKVGPVGHAHDVVSPVRTYESPMDRRLEEAGFHTTARVTLLLKETLIRVAEPALVPAVR